MERVLQSKTLKILMMFLIVTALSWVHSALETADNSLLRKVYEVKVAVEGEDWQEAKWRAQELRDEFEEKRWVMELFGPTEHVSVARYNVISLVEAVNGEQQSESLQLIARIRERINEFIVF